MIPLKAFYILDKLLQDIQNNDIIFGSNVLIFGGYFQKILPVVPNIARTTTVKKLFQLLPSLRFIQEVCVDRNFADRSK